MKQRIHCGAQLSKEFIQKYYFQKNGSSIQGLKAAFDEDKGNN
jgi:hypothetical protein